MPMAFLPTPSRGWTGSRTRRPSSMPARRALIPWRRARACKRLGSPSEKQRLASMSRDFASERSSSMPSRTSSTGSERPSRAGRQWSAGPTMS
jgi:hypothetical protein